MAFRLVAASLPVEVSSERVVAEFAGASLADWERWLAAGAAPERKLPAGRHVPGGDRESWKSAADGESAPSGDGACVGLAFGE